MKRKELTVGDIVGVKLFPAAGRNLHKMVRCEITGLDVERKVYAGEYSRRMVTKSDGVKVKLLDEPPGWLRYKAGDEHVVTTRDVLAPWSACQRARIKHEAEQARERRERQNGQDRFQAARARLVALRCGLLTLDVARDGEVMGWSLNPDMFERLLDLAEKGADDRV